MPMFNGIILLNSVFNFLEMIEFPIVITNSGKNSGYRKFFLGSVNTADYVISINIGCTFERIHTSCR